MILEQTSALCTEFWGIKNKKFKFLYTFPTSSNFIKSMMINLTINCLNFSQELQQTLPVLKPDFQSFSSSPERGIRHMWIGHASSLVQFDSLTFLTDPVFSDRCAPLQWIGPKRYRPVPCSVKELPHIDFVVISHNHYDHLDYNSVIALNRR